MRWLVTQHFGFASVSGLRWLAGFSRMLGAEVSAIHRGQPGATAASLFDLLPRLGGAISVAHALRLDGSQLALGHTEHLGNALNHGIRIGEQVEGVHAHIVPAQAAQHIGSQSQ